MGKGINFEALRGGKMWVMIFCAALGLLLIFFGSGFGEEKKTGAFTYGEYHTMVEDEIIKICESVGGVSEINVIVSFDSAPTYIDDKIPEIYGVGIVCFGGDDAVIKNKLISLLSATYGINSNHIFVTGK